MSYPDLEKEALIQLVAWLANVATKQADCRHEAIAKDPEGCREHIMMRFPIIQGYALQRHIRQIGAYPVDQDNLNLALKLVSQHIHDHQPTETQNPSGDGDSSTT